MPNGCAATSVRHDFRDGGPNGSFVTNQATICGQKARTSNSGKPPGTRRLTILLKCHQVAPFVNQIHGGTPGENQKHLGSRTERRAHECIEEGKKVLKQACDSDTSCGKLNIQSNPIPLNRSPGQPLPGSSPLCCQAPAYPSKTSLSPVRKCLITNGCRLIIVLNHGGNHLHEFFERHCFHTNATQRHDFCRAAEGFGRFFNAGEATCGCFDQRFRR